MDLARANTTIISQTISASKNIFIVSSQRLIVINLRILIAKARPI